MFFFGRKAIVVRSIEWIKDGIEDLELGTLGLMRLEGELLDRSTSTLRSLRV